ncbi:MAG: L-2-amino-thiazoline-4-carboxylic acid hydrolase [Methanothrix sp.]|jgi:hypothetical protein|uniref:L-2-amino-thiazoline-4-carboxylic acid hydrolase n=1 Tax=Methanothrix thermoacetophila (strain DSM 6194 / JCM 14653 / NBRC 101360 / PT) TaxID=349307 RepID=A0B890_METTP|nr:DUF6125 family protein [Methanothrix sp.]ABK14914.1 hypothetical protein Mthe_1131 [Methanothrix thermoacetophila PT]MBC7078911.1 L-2-amino-thiazoline-4-carboxylic acid hydrolase [Methanothrix sp.]NPU87071.1 hypothetical protein [Methanothrix sp.]
MDLAGGSVNAELDDRDVIEYFKRSYRAVDGLWFMKVEERYGFDTALEIDDDVWRVMPKIQARALKSIMNESNGLESLARCFTAKLSLEEFEFASTCDGRCARFVVTRCPWHEIMVRAGRAELNERVGSRICWSELEVWASEFGDGIVPRRDRRICRGDESCEIEFELKNGAEH